MACNIARKVLVQRVEEGGIHSDFRTATYTIKDYGSYSNIWRVFNCNAKSFSQFYAIRYRFRLLVRENVFSEFVLSSSAIAIECRDSGFASMTPIIRIRTVVHLVIV